MVSEHAKYVLAQPLTREVCYDFREVRSRVMYKAWDIMNTEKVPFRIAVTRAWDWARTECGKAGAIL